MRRWLTPERLTALPASDRVILLSTCHQITTLEAEIDEIEGEIARCVADVPAVQMLLTITGVGLISAAATWAILEDPLRFLRAKQVARYAGLDPSIVQSGMAAGTEALEIHGIGEEDPIELRRSWRFDLDRYLAWLERLTPWWKRCLFITAPDVWGNAEESLAFGLIAIPELKMLPFPVALPVQDGPKTWICRGAFFCAMPGNLSSVRRAPDFRPGIHPAAGRRAGGSRRTVATCGC